MRASGADRCNRVAFQLVVSLTRRAMAPAAPGSVAARAVEALQHYKAGLIAARARARATAAETVAAHPDAADRLQALLDGYQFRAVETIARRLQQRTVRPAVAALTQTLNTAGADHTTVTGANALSAAMREQETSAVDALHGQPTPGVAKGELKSLYSLQNALAIHSAEQLLAQEMRGAAADSGPLNPQMLAIKSLAAMGEISPAYLGRFVAYVDSLFWLEQASAGYSSPQP
jgi:hypothetical protein